MFFSKMLVVEEERGRLCEAKNGRGTLAITLFLYVDDILVSYKASIKYSKVVIRFLMELKVGLGFNRALKNMMFSSPLILRGRQSSKLNN